VRDSQCFSVYRELVSEWIGLKEKLHEAEYHSRIRAAPDGSRCLDGARVSSQLPKLPDKKSRAPGDGTQASGPNGNGEQRPWRPARRTQHSIKPREPDLLLVVERTQEPQERWPDG
jgi:hypothetical protein